MHTLQLLPVLALAALIAAPLPAQGPAHEYDAHHLQDTAKSLERGAADFSNRFAKELNKSIFDKTPEKKLLVKRGKEFRKATKDVRGKLKSGKPEKARDRLDRAMQLANDLHIVMRERRFSERLEDGWAEIVNDINLLASYYDLRPLS